VDQFEVDLKLLSSDMFRLTKQVEKLVEEMRANNENSHQSEIRQEKILNRLDRMMEEIERAHKRIDSLDTKSSDFSTFKTKVITYGTVGSVVLAFISQFIVKHFG
jgi:translation initiation factor 2B subunit (eIF-2B alpha/beta/delta family)